MKTRLLRYPASDIDLMALFDDDSFRDFDSEQHDGNIVTSSEQFRLAAGNKEADTTTLGPGQTLEGTGFRMLRRGEFKKFPAAYPYRDLKLLNDVNELHSSLPDVSLTAQDVMRWRMAWCAFLTRRQEYRLFGVMGHRASGTPALIERCEDWPDVNDIDFPIALGFTTAALLYGALHALAWSTHFESSAQQLLWRTSACVVMGGAPAMYVLHLLYKDLERSIDDSDKKTELKRYIFEPVVEGVSSMVLLAYILARAYLVVECFISLSHLPADVYKVPNWPAYFPHIN